MVMIFLILFGEFILGFLIGKILNQNKPSKIDKTIYDVYNNAAQYANSTIIPKINAKYDGLTEDPQILEQYNKEYSDEWNRALAVEIMKTVGYKDYTGYGSDFIKNK